MALPQQFLPAVTAEQYLDLERASELRHEFLDGLVYAMAGETPDHSTICFNLASTIGSQIREKPCRGFSPNMKVYAYQDLMIVCGQAKFHDELSDVLLDPTVVFEVISPSTEKYDRGEKFRRYTTHLDSLQDYVMVSQDQQRIEHYHREPDGSWSPTEISGPDGELVLSSIDCKVPLVEVYRNTQAVAH